MMSTAAVIPVFNEGGRMDEVLAATAECGLLDDIFVVNDGSSDATAAQLESLGDRFTVLHHGTNIGKGGALNTGVTHAVEAGHSRAVFLDGDLRGVTAEHVAQLLEPLDNGSYMSIGYLGLRKAAVKKAILNNWGALSGQRAIDVEVWGLLSPQDKHRFNVEAALNARLRKAGLHHTISRVALEGVGHVGKRDKEGNWPKAVWGYTKTYSSAFLTYTRIEAESLQASLPFQKATLR